VGSSSRQDGNDKHRHRTETRGRHPLFRYRLPVSCAGGERNGVVLRALKVSFIAVILSGVLPLSPLPIRSAGAATFRVTRQNDPAPNGCRQNDCSLREAVIAANNRPGPDTIRLPRGRYELTRPMPDEDASLQGDLDIAKDVAIIGRGPGRTIIDGNRNDRIFHIRGNAEVKISDLAVKRGSRTVDEAQEHGGGGILNLGKLRLANVLVENNRLLVNGHGAGISNQGRLIVSNSRISGNRAPDEGRGGGIDTATGRLVLRNSRVDHNNMDQGNGAGINMDSATARIVRSSVDHNESLSGIGGGLFASTSSEVEVVDSSFNANFVGGCCGGGLGFEDSEALIRGSTIKRNRVEACCGGGLYVMGTSDVVLRGTSISRNRVAGFGGGGLGVTDDATARVVNSRVVENKVNGGCCGGLEVVSNGKLVVVGTLVKGNEGTFSDGGGITTIAAGVGLVVRNSTVVGNLIPGDGGGIKVSSAASAEITNSTISGNTAGDEGGGIMDTSTGTIALTHVTITKNDAGDGLGNGGGISTNGGAWSILRSIVANNLDDDCNTILTGPTGVNLDKDSSCFDDPEAIHRNPRLRALTDNGGKTPTHMPRRSSRAVDAAPGSTCPPPARDQRGVRRPQNGDGEPGSRCDLGAVERKP
jgi:hypothetical protein